MQLQHVLLAVAFASVLKVEAQSNGAIPDAAQFAKGSDKLAKSASAYAIDQVKASKLLPDIEPSDFCQNDGDGDTGGICNGKLTASMADMKREDVNIYRRATPTETLDFLCESAGETKVGFCNSNLPIAQTDDKNKTPYRRISTLELFKQLIPRSNEYQRSTSTVHLCSRDVQDGDLLEIRGYPGLCKRLIQTRQIIPDKALSGSENGTAKAFGGAFKGGVKGYEATQEQLDYSIKHPKETFTDGVTALKGLLKRETDSDGAAAKALQGSYKGFQGSEEQVEYGLQHPDVVAADGVAALKNGLKMRQIIPDKALSGSEEGTAKAFGGAFKGGVKGYEATQEQLDYSIKHPKETFTDGVTALKGLLKKRQISFLLPCVKDEGNSDEAGFCDSIVPAAEERDVVELIRRTIHFNAHRRFARPHAVAK